MCPLLPALPFSSLRPPPQPPTPNQSALQISDAHKAATVSSEALEWGVQGRGHGGSEPGSLGAWTVLSGHTAMPGHCGNCCWGTLVLPSAWLAAGSEGSQGLTAWRDQERQQRGVGSLPEPKRVSGGRVRVGSLIALWCHVSALSLGHTEPGSHSGLGERNRQRSLDSPDLPATRSDRRSLRAGSPARLSRVPAFLSPPISLPSLAFQIPGLCVATYVDAAPSLSFAFVSTGGGHTHTRLPLAGSPATLVCRLLM